MTDAVSAVAEWVIAKRNERRLGRVRVSEQFLDENQDYAQQIGEIVKSEHSWVAGCTEFTFKGPAFDVVPEGETPPLYEVVTYDSTGGKLERLEIRRVDHGS